MIFIILFIFYFIIYIFYLLFIFLLKKKKNYVSRFIYKTRQTIYFDNSNLIYIIIPFHYSK